MNKQTISDKREAALLALWNFQEQINGDPDLYTPALNEALGRAYEILETAKKKTGPFGDRKIGERSAKGVTPPFHPKGADHRKYKSNW